MSDEDTYRLRDKNIKCNHKVIQSTSFQLGRSQNEPLGTLHAIWIKELGFPHDNYWGKQNSCSKPPTINMVCGSENERYPEIVAIETCGS
jgi:hypothetical protein